MNRPSFEDFTTGREQICILGLGYVGLPLAVAFAKRFRVVGFDINQGRIDELLKGHDRTREISQEQLLAVSGQVRGAVAQSVAGGSGTSATSTRIVAPQAAVQLVKVGVKLSRPNLAFSADPEALAGSKLIVVTVPTPIDEHKNPDLTPLRKASEMIGKYIQPGTTVVYESTVYPGCTEEDCLPLIEQGRGLKWKQDFYAGYSPERINPGDKEHTVERIKKVVSGDTPATAELLRRVYGEVIIGGIFVAATIKTAEAAKVIENTQRDLNIALMNELAIIFDRMGIRTLDVLEAAGTKWNFLPFRPGLVGGHCIGVDPYYLTHKAESLGYHPQVILAGRRINDGMGKFIAEKTVKLLIANDRPVKGAKVLILGWTFKEDVPDVRNTRVVDIHAELESFGLKVSVYDPEADADDVRHEYGIELTQQLGPPYEAVVLAVKHKVLLQEFNAARIRELGGPRAPVVIDVKGFLPPDKARESGLPAWQL